MNTASGDRPKGDEEKVVSDSCSQKTVRKRY